MLCTKYLFCVLLNLYLSWYLVVFIGSLSSFALERNENANVLHGILLVITQLNHEFLFSWLSDKLLQLDSFWGLELIMLSSIFVVEWQMTNDSFFRVRFRSMCLYVLFIVLQFCFFCISLWNVASLDCSNISRQYHSFCSKWKWKRFLIPKLMHLTFHESNQLGSFSQVYI